MSFTKIRLALMIAAALACPLGGAALAQDKPPGPGPAAPDGEHPFGEFVLFKVQPGGMEVSVEEVLRDAGERHNMVVAIDEALRGKKIKLYTSAEMNFNMVKTIFSMYGVEIIFEKVDGRQIMKVYLQRNVAQMAVGGPTPFYNEGEKLPSTDQIVTAVYQVRFADANGVQTAIRALMTRDPRRVGNIIYVQRSEALIITDITSQVEFYIKIARALDTPLPGFEYKIVPVQYALADELANMVNQLYRQLELANQGAGGAGQPGQPPQPPRGGQPGGGPQAQVVADVRTNKVVILAYEAEIPKIERLIKEIDIRVDPPPRHFHVYKCTNAYAVDLANQLTSLFGGGAGGTYQPRAGRTTTPRRTGTTGTSGIGGTTRPYGSRQPTTQPATQPTQPVVNRPGTTPGAPTGTLNPGEGQIETRIVPDEQTNSLLIQAVPDDYREILAILKELDRKRMRVMIEAQVWEIAVTDDLFFAVDYGLADDASTTPDHPPGDSGQPLRGQTLGSFGLLAPSIDPADPSMISLIPNFGQGAALGIPTTLTQGGLIFALTKGGFDKVPLILQALATESNANLLTKPFAMTNDNETASFTISESRPFQVATANNVTSFQGFDRAEATSVLSITPRVSSSNNLTLQLELQIESFGAQPNPNAPPPATTRNYTGTVTVPNRQFVVFGGLEQEVERESRQKIPIIGDIPYLGYLFGKTSFGKSRTRIYIFVRPIIFTDDNFEGERKMSNFSYEYISAESLLDRKRAHPVVPDAVLDAESPTVRSAVYGVFGTDGQRAFPEHEKTRAARAAAQQAK